jgi:acyl phosphate:glycerol-3-phosphate acyltransferase
MEAVPAMALSGILGYFLGAIPTGALVARAYGVDLTTHGSRRTGTANVLRTLGARAAMLVFAGDFAKGVAAVLVARMLSDGAPWPEVVANAAAVLGHSFSPLLGWRGGRGVVTAMGGLVVLWPQAALLSLIVGSMTVAATRYISLGSMIGALAGGLSLIAFAMSAGQGPAYLAYGLLVPLFLVLSHRHNIERILSGTERKLGEKA